MLRRYGGAWRAANEGHLSLGQRRVMTAIEICRTAALGGHVERCDDCAHTRIAYNSCRNRHCPKCQWRAAEAWLAAREAELLPVPYFHVVFTLPAALRAIAYQNKAKVYGLLFAAAAEALTRIAADPKVHDAKVMDRLIREDDVAVYGDKGYAATRGAVAHATPPCGSAFGGSPPSGVASATVACICCSPGRAIT